MTGGPVRNVVVAGGGLEGWAVAAALANSLRGAGVTITVTELAGIAPGPAAEHVLPQTLDFFRHLGIDAAALVQDAGATFRLGTRRRDWPAPGIAPLVAFGRYGADVGFILSIIPGARGCPRTGQLFGHGDGSERKPNCPAISRGGSAAVAAGAWPVPGQYAHDEPAA
ncbi:MAG: tryptophan 7-halogenase [Woeseiaceae bacterium]|nr:tryptophan 7-halogenase [Woeseiaceae bacterium]